MPEIHRIGAHTTWLEEPDLVVLRLAGDVSPEDAEAINDHHFQIIQGKERIFMLVDMAGIGADTPAGRKTTSSALNQMPLQGLAICHARMEARVMAKMIVTGVDLFKEDESTRFPVKFFDEEPSARTWIEERRRELP